MTWNEREKIVAERTFHLHGESVSLGWQVFTVRVTNENGRLRISHDFPAWPSASG